MSIKNETTSVEGARPVAWKLRDEREWRIEVAGPAGYVRFETFKGATLHQVLTNVRAHRFCPTQDEDGWTRVEVKEDQHCDADAPEELTAAALDVLAERLRQIEAEGWSPEHDDEHDDGGMAKAAGCYAFASMGYYTNGLGEIESPESDWPWDEGWWKPGTPRRMLVKAGALILAEIERIDRATMSATPPAAE